MKHIAVITTSFPDKDYSEGQEAAGSFVYDFAIELSKYAKVTVVAPAIKSYIDRIGNLTIHRFSVPRLPLSLLTPRNPRHWPAMEKTLRNGKSIVADIVKQGDVDHIFALWVLPSGYWAKNAGRKYGVPYSTWALGSDIWTLGSIPLVRQVLRSILRTSRHCFADGYQLAEDVTAISERPCGFLPSSRQLFLKETKVMSTKPPYKLAYLGRWHHHKGTDLLMESLNFISDDDWRRIGEVRIFGGGPLDHLVQVEGEKLRRKGRPVRIGGYMNRQEATELYQWADYVLLPSRIESIPVVFSDAMQTQCPIVAMPVGDLPRLVEQYGIGVRAEKVTAVSFAEALVAAFQKAPSGFTEGLSAAKADFEVASAVNQLLNALKT
jgi:glycosyltransferase involved in cell wall biosynthesis